MSTETSAVGSPAKKKRPWWHWIVAAVVLLFICGIVGNMLPDSAGTDAGKPGAVRTAAAMPKTAEPPAVTEAPKAKVDKAAFDKVETGTSCTDLAAIFGEEGDVMSESEVMGIKSVMLVWKAGIMANVTIMCQNGKVVSKAQLGLK